MKTNATLLGAAIAATLASPLYAADTSRLPHMPPPPHLVAAGQYQAPSDRIIVKYRDRRPAAAGVAMVKSAGAAFGINARHLRTLAVGGEVIVLDRKLDRVAMDAVLRQLRLDPAVEYAIVDHRNVRAFTPNDTFYGSHQWHLKSITGGLNMPPAWDLSQGDGVVVAVLDTGITSHTDLNANVIAGYDFISDVAVSNDGDGRDANPSDPGDWTTEEDDCGDPEGSSWHGTHVAGTIAAVTNNAYGVAGVAYDAKIVPARVLGTCGGYDSDIIDAVVWASGGTVAGVPANANPAEVLNLSLGGAHACSSPMQAAINGARSRGSVIVVAAGNSYSSVEDHSPANCKGVISVASNDTGAIRSDFSNAGTGIDVTAPGGDPGIASTLNEGSEGPGAEAFALSWGTSMAAPHVAGVVALMQAANPLTPSAVETRLKLTAKPIPGVNCPGLCGAGVVDAYDAIRSATGVAFPAKTIELRNGLQQPVSDGSTNQVRRFSITPSMDVTNLKFRLTGGTGNADLYVRRGAQPTPTTYDCRSNGLTNVEECVIGSPVGGDVYHVMVRGTTAFAGASVSAVFNTATFYTGTDVAIRDQGAQASSTIRVNSRAGNAPSDLAVAVTVYHPRASDLALELRAPDGTIYPLKAAGGSPNPNVITEYTVNASSEVANGLWYLRAQDSAEEMVGHIEEWSLSF